MVKNFVSILKGFLSILLIFYFFYVPFRLPDVYYYESTDHKFADFEFGNKEDMEYKFELYKQSCEDKNVELRRTYKFYESYLWSTFGGIILYFIDDRWEYEYMPPSENWEEIHDKTIDYL